MRKLRLLVFTLLLAAGITRAAPVAAQATGFWTGSYFANPHLQGEPTFLRDDPAIDFSWGGKSPGGNIPSENFSVRWTRWLLIDVPGEWTFITTTDDGVRLFVDDNLVIDAWGDQPASTRSVTLNLTQSFHLVRMEYFQRAGDAQAHLQITSAVFPDWRGEYYNNPDLLGAPAFVRNDSAINFDFGAAGPGGSIAGTDFSVRWTASPYFDAGAYRFTTTSDDGVRLWIDHQRVIDEWHDQKPTSYSADVTLSAGHHFIKMEYYQHGSNAQASLNWMPLSESDAWRGEYFDNPSLQGAPSFSRDDANLAFNWGSASPGRGIAQGANWSARWNARKTAPTTGYYTVSATADDGIRVWVDNNLVIDQWHDQSPTTYAALVYLNAGAHDWRVEFYQHGGSASLRVQIAPGANAPALAATPPASGNAVVDDGAPGFFRGGAGWRDVAGGYNGHAFAIPNSALADSSSRWARWYPQLPGAGWYQVSVYIPANLATTRSARYTIVSATGTDARRVNQMLYANQWVSLGAYYFSATGGEYVALDDTTYEPHGSTTITVDAIRFSASQ
jgi:hypothetical protein